jgi:hypothetical protein
MIRDTVADNTLAWPGAVLVLLLVTLCFVVTVPVASGADRVESEQGATAALAQGDFSEADFESPRRVEVGMSLEDALEVVGKAPDSEAEIGAACGMLDVLTWDEDGTRIISVDGTVTSVFNAKTNER